MESIAKYFESQSKLYSGRTNDIQINIGGVQLWDNVIFRHFERYPLYGNKKLKLYKLLSIRELKRNSKHLIQVGKYRKWRSYYKLRIIEIWES